jgi:membrane peptidoglycan carboxypeptidase
MLTLGRSLRTLVLTVVIGGLAVGASLAALIPGTVELAKAHHYTANVATNLSALSQRTTVYDVTGNTVIGTLGLQDRQPITFDEVPARVLNAVIATEDRTFWTNDGIDVGAAFRAFLINLSSGRIEQGGSTITQQLVKNRILTPKRDVHRKVKEMLDALRLNERFSKQKIMQEYLNTVYFGQGSWGIKSAASRFFYTTDPGSSILRGKNLDELTVGEAALLAGLISNPEGNNPFTYPDRARRRRADVLRGEVTQKYITQAEADAANNEPLPTIKPPAELRPDNLLVAEVQDRLISDPRYASALGSTVQERRDKVLKGGLKIYTTFDLGLQQMAEDAANNVKPPKADPEWVASLVAIEPATGAVRAMVGSPDFQNSQYNIATHPIGRQPGSTWKVITLAAALQNGYSPHDFVDGSQPCSVPSKFPGADQFTINAEPHEGGYMDLFEATAGSVNCAFVRLSTSEGQDKAIDMAHKLGITQKTLQKILTLSIGTIEATPLEMATVMATIASGGVHHTPYFVQKVVAPDGKILIDETSPGDRAIDTDVANCEQNVLRRVVTSGTGTNAEVPGQEIFGKTGTTDDKTDAWFIGGTPALATAVWYGYRPKATPGAGFGGDSAAPIFRAFMAGALAGKPDSPLPDPGPVCARPGEFVNPDGGRQVDYSFIDGLFGPKVTETPSTTRPGTSPNKPTTSTIVPGIPVLPNP